MTPFLTNRIKVQVWLETNCAVSGQHHIDNEGKVTIYGDIVILRASDLTQFAVQFAEVTGTFNCNHCTKLETLRGAPTTVGNDFYCQSCDALQTLDGAPKCVGGSFNCANCTNLTNLAGAPSLPETFDCRGCINITTLQGAPSKIPGDFRCDQCVKLTNLTGSPSYVGGFFSCVGCSDLTSLTGSPAHIGGYFTCYNCAKLATLTGAPGSVGGNFYCGHCLELKNINGIRQVHGEMEVPDLFQATPANVKVLLQHPYPLQLGKRSDSWTTIVNDYYTSGDFLTAIAAFEAHFGVPFHDTMVAAPCDTDLTL